MNYDDVMLNALLNRQVGLGVQAFADGTEMIAPERPPLRIDITGVGDSPSMPEDVGPAPDDVATQMAAGTEPEGATPMTLGEFATTAADVPAGLLKGGFTASAGLPGDIISIVRGLYDLGASGGDLNAFLAGMEKPTFLPTTEDLKKLVDETLGFPLVPAGASDRRKKAAETAEFVGEIGGAGETMVRGTKAVARMARDIGQEIATTPPRGSVQFGPTDAKTLDQANQVATPTDAAPTVTPQEILMMDVKVGDRQVQVPATEAARLSRAVKNLTPTEQSKFKTNTAKSFLEMLSSLPSKQEFGAAALGGKAKKGWYEGSTQAIVNVFGPDASRFAALLSATSPQTSVESNLYNALQVWKNWTSSGRPTDRDSIVEIMGRSVQGGKGEGSVLDAWINNSVRALSSEDPTQIMLSGPKVDSFMRNLQGNVNEVTNDAWMASFALVDQKIFGGSITKTDPGKGPGYLAMNARVRETADYLTKLTGEKWTPAEVQETIWSWAKTLYETAGAAGEKRSAVDLIKDDAITDELISSTPDFRTLFYDARFQPILEQAGYGEQLAQLRAATSRADVSARDQKPGAGSQASKIDTSAQKKLNERSARRLDKLRKQREKAAAEKAAGQLPSEGSN
jgi:hypothetical protein